MRVCACAHVHLCVQVCACVCVCVCVHVCVSLVCGLFELHITCAASSKPVMMHRREYDDRVLCAPLDQHGK